jgi:hypothetical protein
VQPGTACLKENRGGPEEIPAAEKDVFALRPAATFRRRLACGSAAVGPEAGAGARPVSEEKGAYTP